MCAFHRDANGHLLVDSTPLAEIADRLGTPLYVYSGNGIRDAFTSFASAVAPVAGKVHFALKANSALGVIALSSASLPTLAPRPLPRAHRSPSEARVTVTRMSAALVAVAVLAAVALAATEARLQRAVA